ncbi:MAG: hypothetical protein AMXMBFR64_33820 [Myxococcales bacterium]
MIVLDTHVAIWWTADPSHLSPQATQALAEAEVIGVPAICFWEVALLLRKRRLELKVPVSEWAAAVTSIPRVRSLPLTAEIALLAESLAMHLDPCDRFIVATAMAHGARLCTRDTLIRPLPFVRTMW